MSKLLAILLVTQFSVGCTSNSQRRRIGSGMAMVGATASIAGVQGLDTANSRESTGLQGTILLASSAVFIVIGLALMKPRRSK